ncbi:hypothetical protein APSETT444_005561 [Aspergillus pseudonomiae]
MGLPFWHDREKDAGISVRERNTSQESTIQDGAVKYTAAEGVNSTSVTYQDASGAPVETDSPLGYSVPTPHFDPHTYVSEAATILKGVGSVGLSMIYWFIGYLLAQSTLAVYLELASYFPSRSGSEVVYLEQAFPKPAYLFPTVFAAKHVIFSFGSSNSIVFAQYVFGIAGSQYTNWQLKGVAVAAYTVATLVHQLTYHYRISIAGLVVLGGHTKVEDPMINWHDAWKGTSSASAYGATNAMVKIIFSYAGYTNAFSVVNEIKNPIKTLRWSAPFSLILVTSLYILVNVAYFSAASREEILNSKQIAAGIFFKKIFGTNGAARALNVLICISAFGNLMAVMTDKSDRIVVDLSVYPTSIFNFLLVTGLLLIRWRRSKLNLPRPEFRSWAIAIGFALLANLYLLAAPWYPPIGGATGGDVSFWYGTYMVVGIGLLAACGVYYYIWITLLPKYKGYEFRQTVLEFDDGSVTHNLVKVPVAELASWDAEHDAVGRLRHRTTYQSSTDVDENKSSIAYTVPDLDASVRVFINSSDTGRSITCLEAELSNGKTVYQPGVGWTTAIISGLGLAASAVTSALGHSKAATHIAANVISLFGFMQSQAMFGMSSVHMPPIVQSWTQNFQWSMGLNRVGFLETLCTWYQRSTGGKPSTLIVDHSKKSIQVLKKRSYDTLRKRTVRSGADTHKSIVIRGIQRVGYKAGIEVTNIFLTGLIFFVFFATLAMICIAIARVIHKSLVRSGKIKDDEVKWNFIMKGILFRVILLGNPQICILCLWEFTQHDSSAEVILAAVMLLTTTVAIGFATQKVARLAKQSVKLHRNPAYILYTDPACLNKWGFLYVQYQAKAYWFIMPALVYIIVKSMFISLSQAAPVVQTIALVIIETSMLISVCILRPWMNKKTDIYNISIAAINFVNAVFLLIFSNVFSQPGILTGVMGVVFFAYNAVFSLVLLVLVLIASIYAVVSKNPDIRYQPMRDDRESFIRSQSQHQLGTELDALGAAARGDKHSTHDNSTPSLVDPLDRREHYNEENSEDTLEEGPLIFSDSLV